MAVLNLFSKRKKASEKAGKSDVFTYDTLPQSFRVQVTHILSELIGQYQRPSIYDLTSSGANERWEFLHNALAREKGKFRLSEGDNVQAACMNYVLHGDTDDALDFIEVAFRLMERVCEGVHASQLQQMDIDVPANTAIEELNTRFREHALGYEFVNSEIVRIDSQYVHAEAVKPTLALLANRTFQKANEEFMTAHRHYRESNYKECVVAVNRAFETTLKTICTERRWSFKPGDRATELIALVRNKGLFPQYLDKGFDSYIAALKTGLPGVRNNAGGHGDDPNAPPVPDYIARYALHLAASNILLVVEAYNA